jgi:hypothetical protein
MISRSIASWVLSPSLIGPLMILPTWTAGERCAHEAEQGRERDLAARLEQVVEQPAERLLLLLLGDRAEGRVGHQVGTGPSCDS